MSWTQEKEMLGRKLTKIMYENGLIRTWYRDRPSGWKLVSGLWSPFYIQLRPTCSYDHARFLLKQIGTSLWRIIQEEASEVNKLLGVAFSGIPIAIATTMVSGIPSCYTRKIVGDEHTQNLEKKIAQYGEHALVEGELRNGDVIAVIDDVVTRFDSKLVAISKLQHEIRRRHLQRIECNDVVVLIDREQGAGERARKCGVVLHSLIPFKSKGIEWLKEYMTPQEYEVIKDYLDKPTSYQNDVVQSRLRQMACDPSIPKERPKSHKPSEEK